MAEAELHAQLAAIAEANATEDIEETHKIADRVLVRTVVALAELHYGSVPGLVAEILDQCAAKPKWYA